MTGFQFVLDKDIQEFLDESGLMDVIERIAEHLGIDVDFIVITDLIEGSTDISGVVSASDENEANANADSLASAELGYTVLSSSINVYYDDELYEPTEEDEVPLGLIIGCSVGGVVLIGIIIFVVYKVKQRNAKIGQELGEQSVNRENQNRKEWGSVEVINM